MGANDGGTITQSYSAVKVTAGTNSTVGGLVAINYGGPVTSSYWDTQKGGPISEGGIGLTNSQLQSGALPAGFDPTVWSAALGKYPALVVNPPMINVTATPTGPLSLSHAPTSMLVVATPVSPGMTIQGVASVLGYSNLDWVQEFVGLPNPSPYYECHSVSCTTDTQLTSTDVPFNDPPLYGYTYDKGGTFPFYYDPATLSEQVFDAEYVDGQWTGPSVETNSTLALYDSPADDCLPGGSGNACGGHEATTGELEFRDYLVGLVPCSAPGVGQCDSEGFQPSAPIPFEYDGVTVTSIVWTDSFNGDAGTVYTGASGDTGSGGVAVINLAPVDALSGSGGVVAVPPSVPEPSAWTMMLLGFTGLGLLRYRSMRTRAASIP